MKKIIVLFSIILMYNLVLASGFNHVIDNNLDQGNYSLEQFKQDFIDGDFLLCVNNYSYWGNGVEFKDRWTVKFDINSQIMLIHEKTGINVQLTDDNFNKFKNSFISKDCFKFENQFPVKFFKVKTAHNLNQKFSLKTSPNGELIQTKNSEIYLFYYCYKKININEKEYVLLGTKIKFDPELNNDIKTVILGWILYKDRNKPVNTVLWNTNIGLRPAESENSSILIYKDLHSLKQNKSKPKPNDLLVSKEGIKRYINRYTIKNGQTNRWLPLYKSGYENKNSLPIGVIEKLGEIRRDLENLVTAKEFNIVYLIDNTASMTSVWNNLYKTVNSSINTLLTDFTNIAGDSIEPKIKIMYYSDNITVLNNEWIRTVKDLKKYKDKIASIKPINSKYYRPEIQSAFNNVINEIGNTPLYIVVIGDAGDHKYRESFFDLFKIQAKSNLIIPKGVRYNSALKDSIFPIAFSDFKNNFELLFDIPTNRINDQGAVVIGKQIGLAIKDQFKFIIEQYPDMLSGSFNFNENNNESYSIFTMNYLKTISNQLKSFGGGSFYEEGYLYTGKKQNYGKDIIVDEFKLRLLKDACNQFRHDNSSENLKFAIRQICAGFFEIDYQQVTDNFLLDTKVSDFWAKVVGNKEIANIIVPGLFSLDKSFADIVDYADQYIDLFNKNAAIITKNIAEHLNTHKGKFYEVKDPDTHTVEKFYWVEVETLNLFKGIK